MVWTPPTTWTPGPLSSSALNTQLRDNLKAIGDPWTAYNPTWTAATTNPTIGNGSLTGAYSAAGKMINYWIELVMGSTTTYGSGAYSLSLPVAEAGHRWNWTGTIRDASPFATYAVVGERASSGNAQLRILPATAGAALTSVAQGTPITFATGDVIFLSGTYEGA